MFLGSLYKPKQTCIVGYLCLLFVFIGRAKSYGRSQLICWRHNTMRQLLSNGIFQIIKWIRNQLFEWRVSKLFMEGNGIKAYDLKFP